MNKPTTPKPIFQILIICYFLPLCCLSLYGASGQESAKTAFALCLVVMVACALILYFTLKKWDMAWQLDAKMSTDLPKVKKMDAKEIETPKKEEQQSKVLFAPPPQEELKEEIKQKEDEIKILNLKYEELLREKKLLFEQHEQEVNILKLTYEKLDEECKYLKSTLQDERKIAQETIQTREQEVVDLKTQISHLNFELRTLLKLQTS